MNATMSLDNKKHYPVMLDQVLSIISPQHGGTFIDCTFGGGGYSRAILKYPGTKVFAIDRDKITEHYVNDLSKKFPDRFNFCRSIFSVCRRLAYCSYWISIYISRYSIYRGSISIRISWLGRYFCFYIFWYNCCSWNILFANPNSNGYFYLHGSDNWDVIYSYFSSK